MGAGVACFKQSRTGNGPSTAMGIAVAEWIGIDFSIILIAMNCFFFIAEFIQVRELIGIGTFVNWFLVGPTASLFDRLFTSILGTNPSFLWRIVMMVGGILLLSLANSLYQSADLGIAPYDSISIFISRNWNMRYFLARVLTDSLCVIVTLFFHGTLGIGTIICAFGLGPFISFFTKKIALPLLHQDHSLVQ